jgi:hypothetical protein
MRDFCALGQKPHSLHKPNLLPPFPKGHSDFLLRQPFDRPLPRSTHPAELTKRSTVARIPHERFSDPNQSGIGHMRKLQWDRRRHFQLMKDYGDQVRLPFRVFATSIVTLSTARTTGNRQAGVNFHHFVGKHEPLRRSGI